MIAVNLLPEEFRVKLKTELKLPYLQYAILGGVLLFFITLGLFVDYFIAAAQWGKLSKDWDRVQPQFQELNQLQAQVEGILKQEKEFMEKFVITKRYTTSLLSWVSEFLPDSSWLTEVRVDRLEGGGSMLIKGLVLPPRAKSSSSIEQVEAYIQKVKEKIPDARLNLTTTRQTTDKIELTQFVANFDWGQKKA
ncbi:MAG: hypothetical protein HYZ85_04060 [Candidatus Omnitrophica bacterium]|nr:hypothetical protein [Candidatus Omnitrophota bacterium]